MSFNNSTRCDGTCDTCDCPPAKETSDLDRKGAEYAYSVTAFDYAMNPIGSRDWMLFWAGWKAAKIGGNV
jgi:hypothetical protein